MNRFKNFVLRAKLWKDVKGQDLIEYALMAGFVAVLLCSNLIGPAKVCAFDLPFLSTALVFGAGNIFSTLAPGPAY